MHTGHDEQTALREEIPVIPDEQPAHNSDETVAVTEGVNKDIDIGVGYFVAVKYNDAAFVGHVDHLRIRLPEDNVVATLLRPPERAAPPAIVITSAELAIVLPPASDSTVVPGTLK